MNKKRQAPERERILGRKLARELTREELEEVSGSVATWTMTYPPDGPYNDKPGGGGI
jgi:hypothetical protein